MSGRRRSGGRAGRIAERAAEVAIDDRPIRPGMAGGKYAPLTESDMESILATALDLLERTGMGTPIPEFIEVTTEAGGWMDDDGRLHFPTAVVQNAIATAAKSFIWHGFDDDLSLDIGGDRVHFSTAGAAVNMFDHATNTFRHSTAADLYDCARLVDTLDNIHAFVRTVVARDLEDARVLDINTAYATVLGTSKPVGTSFFQRPHVYDTVEMLDMMGGGEGSYAKRPWVVMNATFVVPPMRFAEETTEGMVAAIETGMPINLLSAGQAGATSPATLAGSLVQALAECLAGLTCVNLMKPGHPCVMGMWPFVSDLRTGAMSGGSGEEGVLNAAAAQLLNWMGLPSGVAAGMADSKVPDNQSGYEKGLNVSLAAHCGANIIYESAGMLASLLACSLESLVIDNDMLGYINRTVRGIEVTPETLAAGLIHETIHGDGHFLGAKQTLDLMQKEYIYPVIGDRQTPDDWQDAGGKDARDMAHDYVNATLATHFPKHISRELDDRIRAAFPITLPSIYA